MTKLPEPLLALAERWLDGVRAPRRRAFVAGFCLVFTLAMLVARLGTTRARLGAFALVLASIAAMIAVRVHDRRVFSDPARTIRRVAGRVEPELAQRAIRALSLLLPGGAKGASSELAELHVRRTLA